MVLHVALKGQKNITPDLRLVATPIINPPYENSPERATYVSDGHRPSTATRHIQSPERATYVSDGHRPSTRTQRNTKPGCPPCRDSASVTPIIRRLQRTSYCWRWRMYYSCSSVAGESREQSWGHCPHHELVRTVNSDIVIEIQNHTI